MPATFRLITVSGGVTTGRRSGMKAGASQAAAAVSPAAASRLSTPSTTRPGLWCRHDRMVAVPSSTIAGTHITNP